MSEKIEALRLADLLEKMPLGECDEQAAAELRRLAKVEAQRDALLEALKSVLCRFDPQAVPGYEINIAAVEQAEAAIKAVEERK